MTRKDFQLIADVLRKAHEHFAMSTTPDFTRAVDRVIEEFAEELKHTNHHFNKDKFMKAAGFTQG